jgi:hypothetical protein
MTSRAWTWLVTGLIAYALFSPSTARAAGVILVTWGETITHVGDPSPEAKRVLGSRKIGYKYGYWGIFWADLWTHGGTYCVYEGKRYGAISPAEAAQLLGKSEGEVSAPFLYHVPLGWLILGPLVVVGCLLAALEKKKPAAPGQLFQDPRYQKALEVVNEQLARQPAPDAPVPGAEPPAAADDGSRFRTAFEAGVGHLVAAGIPREEAERNLATLIEILIQTQPPEGASPPAGGPAEAAVVGQAHEDQPERLKQNLSSQPPPRSAQE